MRFRIVSLALWAAIVWFLPLSRLGGQSAGERVALGDRDRAALNLTGALKQYEAALLASADDYDALAKAAAVAVELGEFNPSPEERAALYRSAEQYARRAVAANPSDAAGHFDLALALGRTALSVGIRERIKYATEVRDEALEALRYWPTHAGALHVMGVWNAEVMRLSGFSRMIARKFLGGRVFGEASWNDAQRYLEESVASEPNRIVHRLDLARVYVDRGYRERAREQLEWIARAPSSDYNDRHYKEQGATLLGRLR
jgi:tetratricopeptide (TPR) repeat protein